MSREAPHPSKNNPIPPELSNRIEKRWQQAYNTRTEEELKAFQKEKAEAIEHLHRLTVVLKKAKNVR